MKVSADKNLSKKISFPDNDFFKILLGEHDKNLKCIERLENIKIQVRGNTIILSGDAIAVALIEKMLQQLYHMIEKGYPIYKQDIDYAFRMLSETVQLI